ncbi:hypothetical protein INR49_017125 [Caranx melampygus]|nr:hypothetical protein INR49_017125 [Caranx melampygus]
MEEGGGSGVEGTQISGRGVLGWLGPLCMWPWDPRCLYSPVILLQQLPSPLGLSLHGSTVALPVSTSISLDPSDSQPGRQVEHVLQNLFIELKACGSKVQTYDAIM